MALKHHYDEEVDDVYTALTVKKKRYPVPDQKVPKANKPLQRKRSKNQGG